MRGFLCNSSNVFKVVGFGTLYGATHSTFHVKKHPTYMLLMKEDLLSFSLKIHHGLIWSQNWAYVMFLESL
jgi:hypothetical protein